MDAPINTGEANPAVPAPQNTANQQLPNRLPFDEAALSRVIKARFNTATEQSPEPVAADAVEPATDATPPAVEEEAEPVESPADDLSQDKEEQHSGVQKRIDKLVAQKKEAVERAESLERELEAERAKAAEKPEAPPAASPSNPFADVWSDSALGDEWTKARDLKRWCEDNREGTELNGREYTSDEVKRILRNVEDAIDIHIPKRAAFLQQHRALRPIAEQMYPWWKDKASPERAEASNILRQLPMLAQLPEHQVLIGDFLEGRKSRLARSAAKTAAPAAVAPKVAPRQPAAPTASPVRGNADAEALKAAKKKFMSSGGVSDLAQMLKGNI